MEMDVDLGCLSKHLTAAYDNPPVLMENYGARLASYKDWPHKQALPRLSCLDLAKAGFYYLGSGDAVKCFSCSVVLQNWDQRTSAPKDEHKQKSQDCGYLVRTITSVAEGGESRGRSPVGHSDVSNHSSESSFCVKSVDFDGGTELCRPLMQMHSLPVESRSTVSKLDCQATEIRLLRREIELLRSEMRALREERLCPICRSSIQGTVTCRGCEDEHNPGSPNLPRTRRLAQMMPQRPNHNSRNP